MTAIQLFIDPMPENTVFRAFDKRQIKAQLAGKTHSTRYSQSIRYAHGLGPAHGAGPGCSIDKSCNTELALIKSP